MNAMARSAIALTTLLAASGALLSLVFRTGAERRALLVSAILAALVQMTAFWLVHKRLDRNAIVAWGMGSVLRVAALALYGLVLARMLDLPLTAALTSFAIFLFLTMLLESMLLAYGHR